MEGVSIIATEEWNGLKKEISALKMLVLDLAKMAKNEDPIMTSLEVQDYLKKGSTWVDSNKHKIGCSRVGGEWRFRKSNVDEFINNTHHKDQ